MTPWRDPALELPTPDAEVWIRRFTWLSRPTLATWDPTTETFACSLTGLTVPAYIVQAWKWP